MVTTWSHLIGCPFHDFSCALLSTRRTEWFDIYRACVGTKCPPIVETVGLVDVGEESWDSFLFKTAGWTVGWFFVSKTAKLTAIEERTADFLRPLRCNWVMCDSQLCSVQRSVITPRVGSCLEGRNVRKKEQVKFFKEELNCSLKQEKSLFNSDRLLRRRKSRRGQLVKWCETRFCWSIGREISAPCRILAGSLKPKMFFSRSKACLILFRGP